MRIISRLASRLAWLTATPLGSEVEPEVYCRNAMACGSGRGNSARSACAAIEIDREPLQPVALEARLQILRAA